MCKTKLIINKNPFFVNIVYVIFLRCGIVMLALLHHQMQLQDQQDFLVVGLLSFRQLHR